jgi:hypothetical protein
VVDDAPLKPCYIKLMFAAMCFLEILANFDSGVIPGTLTQVQASFEPPINDGSAGSLGSLGYIGMVICAPAAGYALTNFASQQRVLFVTVTVNCLAVFAMAYSPSEWYLWIARLVVGFAQSPLLIYLPVWVDEFAPQTSMTLWVALLQAHCALGIMFGYLVGGMIVNYTAPDVQTWRYALYLQAFCLIPFIFLFSLCPNRYVNLRSGIGGNEMKKRVKEQERKALEASATVSASRQLNGGQRNKLTGPDPAAAAATTLHASNGVDGREYVISEQKSIEQKNRERKSCDEQVNGGGEHKQGNGAHLGPDRTAPTALEVPQYQKSARESVGTPMPKISMCEQLRGLWRCDVFVYLTIAMCGLYWVVTGIQFWITKYLTQIIGTDPKTVTAVFSIVSLAAPISGVFFGGWVVDKYGGYKDDETEGPASGAQQLTTLKICTRFGIMSVVSIIPSAISRDFATIIVSIVGVLFFGGALVPPATGVAISSVPKELKAFGNAMYMGITHLFGYAAAPVACGWISQLIGGDKGLTWGFRINQSVAPVAVFFMWIASRMAEKAVVQWQRRAALIDGDALEDMGSEATQQTVDGANGGLSPAGGAGGGPNAPAQSAGGPAAGERSGEEGGLAPLSAPGLREGGASPRLRVNSDSSSRLRVPSLDCLAGEAFARDGVGALPGAVAPDPSAAARPRLPTTDEQLEGHEIMTTLGVTLGTFRTFDIKKQRSIISEAENLANVVRGRGAETVGKHFRSRSPPRRRGESSGRPTSSSEEPPGAVL